MGFLSKEKEAYPKGSSDSYGGAPPPTYDMVQPPSYDPSVAPSSVSSNGQTIKFPTKMVLKSSLFSTKSTLGPTKDEPMFQVVVPSKMYCFGSRVSILKDGTDKLSAPLASVGPKKKTGWKKSHSLISLSRPGDQDFEITMEDDHKLVHPFTMPINGQETRFEWRNTSGGAEVKALSGGYNWGWKLVRIDGPYTLPGGYSGKQEGFTSDGREIVAVGAQPKLFCKSPEFMYIGSGARGEMGQDFEVVALMGFLRLYELFVQQQMAASSASSASASSGAAAAAAS